MPQKKTTRPTPKPRVTVQATAEAAVMAALAPLSTSSDVEIESSVVVSDEDTSGTAQGSTIDADVAYEFTPPRGEFWPGAPDRDILVGEPAPPPEAIKAGFYRKV